MTFVFATVILVMRVFVQQMKTTTRIVELNFVTYVKFAMKWGMKRMDPTAAFVQRAMKATRKKQKASIVTVNN